MDAENSHSATEVFRNMAAGIPGAAAIYRCSDQFEIVSANRDMWRLLGCESQRTFSPIAGAG